MPRVSLPRLLNIVSLRTLLCHTHPPPRPATLALRLHLPRHRCTPSPLSLATPPAPLSPLSRLAPTSATKHECPRIFIVTSRAASSCHPTPLLRPFFMRLLTISSNCTHPNHPTPASDVPFGSYTPARPAPTPLHLRVERFRGTRGVGVQYGKGRYRRMEKCSREGIRLSGTIINNESRNF